MSDDMNDDANRDMSGYTDAFSENDAAYVMGALTEEDRRAYSRTDATPTWPAPSATSRG